MASSAIIQYIVVRGDLGWPTGALIAQGAHASVAAISRSMDSSRTQAYLSELEKMHKVVLKASSEEEMKELVFQLAADGISHHAWMEEPEKIMSAVASAPNEKSILQPYFKKFKLFK